MSLDAAEQWLRENDPDYERTSAAWRHLRGGHYRAPAEEIPAERLLENFDDNPEKEEENGN